MSASTSLNNITPTRDLKRRLLFHQESSETVCSPLAQSFRDGDDNDNNNGKVEEEESGAMAQLIDSIFELSSSTPLILPPGLDSIEGEEEGVRKILISTFKLERFVGYGMALCLDQLLSFSVLLPARLVISLVWLGSMSNSNCRRLLFDLCVAVIISFALVWSLWLISAAQIYHSIRLQTFMKLYVVINIAEVVDRLMCSMGNDLFDLLGDSILRWDLSRVAFRTGLCSLYACAHSILFYVRVLTLSVAMNSSSDALFTILVSNNFVELKGSVFKRSTEENLFQIACSDVVERFVLMVFMALVGLSEYSGQSSSSSFSSTGSGTGSGSNEQQHGLRNSDVGGEDGKSIIPQFALLWSSVLLVEVIVDWIKHSFICRFNSDIRAKEAYDQFLGILAADFGATSRHIFPPVSKRLGLPVVPLCVVLWRVILFDAAEPKLDSIAVLWVVGLAVKLGLRGTVLRWIVPWAGTGSNSEPNSPATTTPVFASVATTVVADKLPTPAVIASAPRPTPSSRRKAKTPKALFSVNRFDTG
ncbi:hypothetical protein BASA81_002384 [Batrachochytrium salamandrivorans]|nr:hypothetical protein BASA81_002384 [Batrachochytrium salamandrivorans]